MRRNPRTNAVLIISGLFVLLGLVSGDMMVLLPLAMLLTVFMLARRPTMDDRGDLELRARAEYEHHALMLGHDAVGIYGRFQPTPLDAVREDLLPEQLRSSTTAVTPNAAPTAATPTAVPAPPVPAAPTAPATPAATGDASDTPASTVTDDVPAPTIPTPTAIPAQAQAQAVDHRPTVGVTPAAAAPEAPTVVHPTEVFASGTTRKLGSGSLDWVPRRSHAAPATRATPPIPRESAIFTEASTVPTVEDAAASYAGGETLPKPATRPGRQDHPEAAAG